jgi:ubiquinone/menaquinone biosynthesis C-methylase UbiE
VTRAGVTAYAVAGHYDERYFANLAERYRRRTRFARQRIRNVFCMLPALERQTVVDLGCGMGTFTIEAARRGAMAVGVDAAAAALAQARRVAGAEAASAAFVRADAARLPIATRSADVVLAADLTEHLDDVTLSHVLSEARRVLRPGGSLVVYTPDRSHLFERLREHRLLLRRDPSHIGLRSAHEIERAVASAGFSGTTVRFLPSHVPGWNLFERAFARWVPLLRRRIGLLARLEQS